MQSFFITLSIFSIAFAALTPCRRDACYRAIGRSQVGSPDASSRRADCVSVLRTVIDDDAIATSTTYTSTFYPSNTVTATATETTSFSFSSSSTLPPVIARAASPHPPRITEAVEKRDTIIVGGRIPKYASPACTDLQAYAIACLCHGIRAQNNLIDARKTITVPGVFTAAPPTRTITRTVTDECVADTGCPQADNECNPGRGTCGCYRTDLGNRCMDNRFCGDRGCAVSSDCRNGEVCEIDSCCGRGNCTPLGTCSDTSSPMRIFRMDLERQRSGRSSKNYPAERRLFEEAKRGI